MRAIRIFILSLFVYHNSFSQELIRIRAVGDMMLGLSEGANYPQDYFFKQVHSELNQAADIVFGNHEGTLCDQNPPTHKKKWAFKSPRHLVSQFKQAGFSVLSLANNHIFDYQEICADETLKTLEDQGIAAIGLLKQSRNRDNSLGNVLTSVRYFTVRGVRIAFAGFHVNNVYNRLLTIRDDAAIKKLIPYLKTQAEIVVVSMHAGAEGAQAQRVRNQTEFFMGENRGNSVAFAYSAIDAGADVIIGHGPHVLRGIEIYKQKVILYSLGNFANYTHFSLAPPAHLGAIVEVGLTKEGTFVQGKIISTLQTRNAASKGSLAKAVTLWRDRAEGALHTIKSLSHLDFGDRAPQFIGAEFYPAPKQAISQF